MPDFEKLTTGKLNTDYSLFFPGLSSTENWIVLDKDHIMYGIGLWQAAQGHHRLA
ncbi:MAG: hypothetical protein IPH22_10770 [Nitrosomonas sp.]|nr:hypothetical protein [Nitrosomonas sp.]